jgi:hypothetical protein
MLRALVALTASASEGAATLKNSQVRILLVRDFGGQAQGFHDGVVDGGADLGDFHVFAGGIDAIGQQDDEECAIGVDPDGRAGEAGVAVAVDREIVATGAAFSGDDPAKRARIFRERLRRGEFRDGGALQDAIVGVDAAVDEHLAEGGKIG